MKQANIEKLIKTTIGKKANPNTQTKAFRVKDKE